MIMPLIATASAANCASTQTARTMVIASIRPKAMCANVRRVMPRTIAPLTLTSASTTSARTARLALMVSPITPACARTAGKDGCEYIFSAL